MTIWITKLPSNIRKEIRSNGKSKEGIAKSCELMINQLDLLLKMIPNEIKENVKTRRLALKNNTLYNWYKAIENIEETKDHFEFCKDFATGEIPKEEWDNYDFDGDLVGLFNNYLTEFWHICDTTIVSSNDVTECKKLCFVEL